MTPAKLISHFLGQIGVISNQFDVKIVRASVYPSVRAEINHYRI